MNPILLSLLLVLTAGAGIILLILFADPADVFDFIITYAREILLILQIAGLFYAGMTSNVKLGLILGLTIVTTVIWGW